jgi:hypothetical protein
LSFIRDVSDNAGDRRARYLYHLADLPDVADVADVADDLASSSPAAAGNQLLPEREDQAALTALDRLRDRVARRV